jgi:hypothetical protein
MQGRETEQLRYHHGMVESREVPSAPEIALSAALDDPEATPYFLWDEPMTVRELRLRLRTASAPERFRLLAKVLREARDTEVWHFTTPSEVAGAWPQLAHRLGRRRQFWAFLLKRWREQGLLAHGESG